MSYEVLKNRMQNGQPFLRETALTRITALADALEISQEQADELTAIAQANGLDIRLRTSMCPRCSSRR